GALVVLDAVGLLTVLASALATIALRTRAYRTHGGLDDATLARTDAVVEAVVLATLAAVARAAGAAA
ncbi:MAG TPA: hypothetical protein VNO26_03225, partial [Candidatus Limnocylindria bacterium]|nr:hypothetical protein [Candidatus Limnocylindria bacterium]